jgi:hypothetical protein
MVVPVVMVVAACCRVWLTWPLWLSNVASPWFSCATAWATPARSLAALVASWSKSEIIASRAPVRCERLAIAGSSASTARCSCCRAAFRSAADAPARPVCDCVIRVRISARVAVSRVFTTLSRPIPDAVCEIGMALPSASGVALVGPSTILTYCSAKRPRERTLICTPWCSGAYFGSIESLRSTPRCGFGLTSSTCPTSTPSRRTVWWSKRPLTSPTVAVRL